MLITYCLSSVFEFCSLSIRFAGHNSQLTMRNLLTTRWTEWRVPNLPALLGNWILDLCCVPSKYKKHSTFINCEGMYLAAAGWLLTSVFCEVWLWGATTTYLLQSCNDFGHSRLLLGFRASTLLWQRWSLTIATSGQPEVSQLCNCCSHMHLPHLITSF